MPSEPAVLVYLAVSILLPAISGMGNKRLVCSMGSGEGDDTLVQVGGTDKEI